MPVLLGRGIFFRVPKTASTALEQVILERNLGRVANIAGPHHGADFHMSLQDFRLIFGTGLYNDLFKWCMVRNPWDWYVSLYHYYQQNADIQNTQEYRELGEWCRDNCFELFINRFFASTIGFSLSDFVFPSNWVSFDRVVKIERLQEDIHKVFELCGWNTEDLEVPVVNKSDRGPYPEYYNERLVEEVRKREKRVIEAYDYQFET